MKQEETMPLEAWPRTPLQELNWLEILCTCFGCHSSSLPWALTSPEGCICYREAPASLQCLEYLKPTREAKKVNKLVIQQHTPWISTARKREMPFIKKADLSLLELWFLKDIFQTVHIHQFQVSLSRPHGRGLYGAQLLPPQELLLSAVMHQRESDRLCCSSSPATSQSFGLALSPGMLRVLMSGALLTSSAN